jgi:hypothetical protein
LSVYRVGKMKKTTKIIIITFAAIVLAGLVVWDVPRNKLEMFLERNAIEKAAHAYFKAEMAGDVKQVYTFLAPSSAYKKTHSFDEFVADLGNYPPVAINTYQIVNIYRLRDNDNREAFPGVEKFVQVEVEITFHKTGQNSVFNYSFTFLKEKGAWYKG